MIHGRQYNADPEGTRPQAQQWARRLLSGLWPAGPSEARPQAPATGAEPALLGPPELTDCADGALDALRRVAGERLLPGASGADLLAERAVLLGIRPAGRRSANGHCRLVPCRGRWLAVNLARPEDLELLPAWLEAAPLRDDHWRSVAAACQTRSPHQLIDRARLLGLPAALVQGVCDSGRWWQLDATRPVTRPSRPPVVVDLSSLWAGPLCTHLLWQAGARVIRVESCERPDPTRLRTPGFFDLLNAGKDSVVLPFRDPAASVALHRLLAQADIVVESARPRALRQLGICAEQIARDRPGMLWLGLTGYGRTHPRSGWVAFGDDAAAAAGAVVAGADGPRYYGDAVSDPLTGLHAAVATLALWLSGRGGVLDVSLAGVTRFCTTATGAIHKPLSVDVPVRQAAGPARPLGADTDAVIAACY